MAKTPSRKSAEKQLVVPEFLPDEPLYRRITPTSMDDGELELDAISLPDMSVNRGRFGEPESVIRGFGDDWGIAKFFVRDIPRDLNWLGITQFTFDPIHEPEPGNYPHSVIRAFENGVPIDAKDKLDREMHIHWRERLLRAIKIHRRPVSPNA